MPEKSIRYIVSSAAGDFIGEWSSVTSPVSFKRQINNSVASLQVSLARNELTSETYTDVLLTEADTNLLAEDDNQLFADILAEQGIGPGTNLELNHKVDIVTHYGSYIPLLTEDDLELLTEDDRSMLIANGLPDGRTIFSGYVSDWEIDYGASDDIKVSLLNNGNELSNIMMKESGGDTKVVFNSYDPSDIARDVIDYAQTQGANINYTADSIEDTGTTVSYTFNLNTIAECLNKIVELCPADWYWAYDPGSDLYSLKSRPTAPDRYFTLKSDVETGTLRRSIANIVNRAFFTGGGDPALLVEQNDATSESTWRKGITKISDQRVTDQTTAELMADSAIDRNKDPEFFGSMVINGNHDDPIEDIMLGEMAGFVNFGDYIDALELQIVGINYNVDTVQLDLDRILPAISKRVQDINRNLDTLEQQNNPDAPV